MQFFLFYKNGIKTDLESAKYIREANNLINSGTVSSLNFWLYSTQIFLIAFFCKIKAGFTGVVIVQLFFNAFATYNFFLFLHKRSNLNAAFFTTLLLIFNLPFNQYNFFLQTESLFHSFSILFVVYLLSVDRWNFKHIALITTFMVLLMFTRPTGILLYPATIVYIAFFKLNIKKAALKILACITLLMIPAVILNFAMGSGGELNFMLPFQKKMIICGVPVNEANIKISSNPNSISGVFYYAWHNFEQFIKLSWQKTISFFGVYRSYYSVINNLFICGWFSLVYVLSIFGLKKWYKENLGIAVFCVIFILATWGSVIFSCDDWHNRWLLTLTPVFLILAIKGIEQFLSINILPH